MEVAQQEITTPAAEKQAIDVSGSVALLEALITEGVETIFGYPGGAIMPIYDALYDYNDKLEHILVRHEQGGIHAAQGFERALNRAREIHDAAEGQPG